MAVAWISPSSTSAALTLPEMMESFERAVSDAAPITAVSLTVDRTFSMEATACSTVARSASAGTSPVISTIRL